MMLVVFFRGRNTAAIVDDSRRAGLVPEDAHIVIVARRDDALREEGDVTECNWGQADHVRVIANGGTTAQAIPLIVALAESAAFKDGEYEGHYKQHLLSPRNWTWDAWDVQRDGARRLAGQDPSPQRSERPQGDSGN